MRQEDGTAVCGACNFRFPLPSAEEGPAPSPSEATPAATAIPATGLVARNVSGRVAPDPVVAQTPEKAVLPARSYEEVAIKHRPNRQKKKRAVKKKRNYKKILGLWLLTVGVAGGVAWWLNGVTTRRAKATQSVVDSLTGDKRAFFLAEYPAIRGQMQGFIASDSSEQRQAYVLKTALGGRRMARHYRENEALLPGNFFLPEPTFWNVAYNESPGFVEIGWELASGRRIEAVFLKVNETWRLDWDHYVRYNTENWTLFRQNKAESSKGTFRLYVEKIDEGIVAEDSWTKVRFFMPDDDEAIRLGSASRIVKLAGDSALTTAILETFIDRSVESDGYSRLWKDDPLNLRRVTVRLAWERDESVGEEMLVVQEIVAQHWRSLDVVK